MRHLRARSHGTTYMNVFAYFHKPKKTDGRREVFTGAGRIIKASVDGSLAPTHEHDNFLSHPL